MHNDLLPIRMFFIITAAGSALAIRSHLLILDGVADLRARVIFKIARSLRACHNHVFLARACPNHAVSTPSLTKTTQNEQKPKTFFFTRCRSSFMQSPSFTAFLQIHPFLSSAFPAQHFTPFIELHNLLIILVAALSCKTFQHTNSIPPLSSIILPAQTLQPSWLAPETAISWR